MAIGKLNVPNRVERAADRPSRRYRPTRAASFGDEVRELRASLDLTQEQFCERYHIPLSNLRNWEQANRKVIPDTAARLLIAMIKVDPQRVAKLVELARENQREGDLVAL